VSRAFKSYPDAFNTAVRLGRDLVAHGCPPEQAEIGLERYEIYKEWVIFMLPRACNRYGHETRCEVVRPTDPLMPEDKS